MCFDRWRNYNKLVKLSWFCRWIVCMEKILAELQSKRKPILVYVWRSLVHGPVQSARYKRETSWGGYGQDVKPLWLSRAQFAKPKSKHIFRYNFKLILKNFLKKYVITMYNNCQSEETVQKISLTDYKKTKKKKKETRKQNLLTLTGLVLFGNTPSSQVN